MAIRSVFRAECQNCTKAAALPGRNTPKVKNHEMNKNIQGYTNEAVTVGKGIKHAANFWIHMFDFQEMLQNGCDNEDYFQYNLMDKDGKVRKRRKDVGPR